MKTIKLFAAAAALLLLSCEKDGDKPVIQGNDSAALNTQQQAVVVTNGTRESVVLTLSWDQSALSTDVNSINPVGGVRSNLLQASREQDFSSAIVEYAAPGAEVTFTGESLNTLAKNKLGIQSNETGTVYFRLQSLLGANQPPVYSNVIAVDVTPAQFPTFLYLRDVNSNTGQDFPFKLCSMLGGDFFEGFVPFPANWWNFKFYTATDATATIYGGSPTAGQYVLDTSGDQWNMWEEKGAVRYDFVVANLGNMTWGRSQVNRVNISGAFNSNSTSANAFTRNTTTNLWTATVNFTSTTGGARIIVALNNNLGTYSSTPVYYYADPEREGVLSRTSNGYITIPGTGSYLITLNFSDPSRLTYTFAQQ